MTDQLHDPAPARETACRVPVLTVPNIRRWYLATHGPLPEAAHTPTGERSREVSFSHTFDALWPVVERALRHGPIPIIGTHDWLELAPNDPARVGAIYQAALDGALHRAGRQSALAEATHDISGSYDWSGLARYNADHIAHRQEHPDLRRPA